MLPQGAPPTGRAGLVAGQQAQEPRSQDFGEAPASPTGRLGLAEGFVGHLVLRGEGAVGASCSERLDTGSEAGQSRIGGAGGRRRRRRWVGDVLTAAWASAAAAAARPKRKRIGPWRRGGENGQCPAWARAGSAVPGPSRGRAALDLSSPRPRGAAERRREGKGQERYCIRAAPEKLSASTSRSSSTVALRTAGEFPSTTYTETTT
ncbi:unnamed protein product [Prorocentrum cordatum]|uniref:Uncharacterized protein n=1 Tax=Prorocentrum cordatum TaxID=2364126 RepID=A0ABN9RLD6_9DINO|nr:unnamed protein product [Polarella glacialis]